MKYLNKLFAIIVLALLFVACEKENSVIDSEVTTPDLTEYTESNPLITRGSGDESGLILDCFTILFPFDLIGEDGSATTFATIDDFETFDPENTVYVDFGYPLTISMDDVESTVEDNAELGMLYASCVPSGGWEEGEFPAYDITFENSCYTLNFPIQLINTADEITTIESEAELIDAVSMEVYYFVFPFDMTREDGEVVTVNNMDEIFEALIECNGFYGDGGVDWEQEFEYIGCYLFTFPFDVVLSDGETVTVNDHMEFCNLMLVGEIVDFAYPITLTDLDGTQVLVNSSAELEALLNECEGWDDGEWEDDSEWDEFNFAIFELWIGSIGESFPDGTPCYEINYPITIINSNDSTELIITNQEEYNELFFGEVINDELYDLDFPVTVTYLDNGEDLTLESSDDILTLLYDCQ